ncbi:MAG: hypothetical protein KME19_12945 [Microcoleus vaginatus WJT46-NPBG5]|jgi:hypothetical protein|nr:hypothetical protein [Microcoleus vaginatus WJT46-NPBG5]
MYASVSRLSSLKGAWGIGHGGLGMGHEAWGMGHGARLRQPKGMGMGHWIDHSPTQHCSLDSVILNAGVGAGGK